MNNISKVNTVVAALALGAWLIAPSFGLAAEKKASGGETKTIKGEVVDLMCYLDHGAKGEKHKGCAETCIKSGGPVGLLSGEDLYLVVGDHKPMNNELASKAGETVEIKGKVVERNGMKMIENAELASK